ncbi:MAG: helix-turn-helix transcriptional regulator, partial [Nocardioides sp.]
GASLLVARPLVADEGQAESLYQGGLAGDLLPWPFLHARHLLAYGTWLRRHRRVRDSRPYLRPSRDIFDALGAVPWYEQATRELRASGETSRERELGADLQLSPQERHIAQLAATGLTNREIGEHLYLSHRTVGSHLYRIFPKLGITSRGQLSSALLGGSLGDHAR